MLRGDGMKYSELKRKLKELGCYIWREGRGHEIWFSPKTGKKFPVGRHGTEDVPQGTLKSIFKDAGIE